MYSEKVYERVVNLYELEREQARPGVARSAYATDDAMLVMNVLEKGMEQRPHKHDDFDQLAMVTKGVADYYIDDTAHRLTEGSLLLVPAGRMHHIVPVSDEVHNLDMFFPPRADYAHLLGYLEEQA